MMKNRNPYDTFTGWQLLRTSLSPFVVGVVVGLKTEDVIWGVLSCLLAFYIEDIFEFTKLLVQHNQEVPTQ